MVVEASHWVGKGAKECKGAVRNVWKERWLSGKAKLGVFGGIVVPKIWYGCKTWVIDENVEKGACVSNEMFENSMWCKEG